MAFFFCGYGSGWEYLKTFPRVYDGFTSFFLNKNSIKEMSGYLPETKKRERKKWEKEKTKKSKFNQKYKRKWKEIEKKSKDSNLYTNRHRPGHGHIETALRQQQICEKSEQKKGKN